MCGMRLCKKRGTHRMDADALPDHPRTALAASWQGFSYGIK